MTPPKPPTHPYRVETETDMLRMFKTLGEVAEFAEQMDVNLIEEQINTRTGITLFRVPEWDEERKAYCELKAAHCRRYGSN